MTTKEYYACTWREFLLRFDGYQLKRAQDFEHTRAIVYSYAMCNWDPKVPRPVIEKFWPLPTDEVFQIDEDKEYEFLKKIMEEAKNNKLN